MNLCVFATGINTSDSIEITGGSTGCVRDGRLAIEVIAGERQEIDLILAETYEGPIELVAVVTAGERSSAN